jgi:hypothetical protein
MQYGYGTTSDERIKTNIKTIENPSLMYSTIKFGTASKATPQGRRLIARGRVRTGDQTISSPMP